MPTENSPTNRASGHPEGPDSSNFLSVHEFVKAHEKFHDKRTPTDAQTLGRAARLAGNAIFAVRLQLARLRKSRIDPTSDEVDDAILRRWADSEFLIIALWRLRTVAQIAASVGAAKEIIGGAITKFDQQLPDLQTMRHVSQHLDDYATDHPRRRQRMPGSAVLIGRRLLEVAGLGDEEFQWLRGRLNFADAEAAANALYSAILKTRDECDECR